ncbi:MAG: hypothetical protein WA609_04195 [Terriglobales bacterium]
MRRGLWAFVLLLLVGVVYAAAVPPTDVPETSYNEIDKPVNQAPPVVSGIRFVRPVKVTRRVPKCVLQARCEVQFPVEERVSPSLSTRQDSHSVQDLLCTLLI